MKRLIYTCLGILIITVSCTKNFLDINTDPNYAAKTAENRLLTSSEQGLSYALGFTNDNRGARGLTEVLSVYMHQVTVREDQDQYSSDGNDINITGSWTGLYSSAPAQVGSDVLGTLQNIDVLIGQGTQNGNMVYVGIAKIIKAYAISQYVDVFGDVPYSQANKFLSAGIRYPKYDKGAEIYPQLFALLDQAIGNINNANAVNSLVPAGDDLFYGGDKEKWIRLAHTIKLKLYNQLRLVQDVSAQVKALIAKDSLIKDIDGGFMFQYGRGTTPDDRNPGYNDYFATQRSHYQSPWFYEILRGNNNRIFTGNPDPRVRYYFYSQLKFDEQAQNSTDFRDSSFVSIPFGSVSVNRDFSQGGSMTIFGIYPVGGRYQADTMEVTGADATGAAPFRMLTYADRLYIEAELQFAGLLPGDAKAKLRQAIQESFNQVDYVVQVASKQKNVPLLAANTGVSGYIDKVIQEYEGKPAAGQLEIIMTQKWISSFGNSVDQYTDYRRTGYPVLFNPRDPAMAPGGFLQPPLKGDPTIAGNQAAIPVQQSRDFPLSLPWSNLDLNVNQNAPPQKQPANFRVFWDKN
ncbi:SusD/RagB family nutrient-binding outer membrane lipoprotein [Chitinophaga nivalis]|uniref:SusD/RagB family nutrient-binding outer membrane lipoprotein n=1 Tax=Chitinophaga nivalis TaxID=2991709 RepID=A0ABT3IUC9_9BACT|nr:SusD/RagB family nutrient-binding outer membrane lipoprotein [Chitinophaga nivalis]MCW3462717.1 SusD/RagB family nutrient-binding outer membrane lipoprotein [Chitinophaga nivalis]MCW3487592.1 SusD/RagB family nutrient-binding outer membrane lipoprotein [Chitinophaga nivalis]